MAGVSNGQAARAAQARGEWPNTAIGAVMIPNQSSFLLVVEEIGHVSW
jgi:hypothetical protein